MRTAPTKIRLDKPARTLDIGWRIDEPAIRYSARLLRCDCRCAACVDEVTGVRILKPESVPTGIGIDNVQMVGNYALKLTFSDGHDVGLFTWDHLWSLPGQPPAEQDP